MKHVLLEKGEILKKGDEWWNHHTCRWNKLEKARIGETYCHFKNPVRRLISNLSMNEWRNMR